MTLWREATCRHMPVHILDAMAREGFEEVVALHDHRSGLRGFLGIHDTSRGPAFGGVRRRAYRDEREALLDCLRLARAMTQKCVLAALPAGGAKAVVLDGEGLDARSGYRHLAEVVERMGGRFYTGPDMGTGPRELAWMAERTRFVTDPGPDGPGELAESTAEGVFRGIGVCLEHLDGETDWARRTVVVQGLGAVGERLAARLATCGARVVGAEVDRARAQRVARALGIGLVDPSRELGTPCDVFAPCASGGVVHDLTLERLRCRVVAGAANNVLARADHGDRLHERGVLYAPDIAINSGALVRGTLFHLEGRREPVERIGDRIAGVLGAVLAEAERDGEPPARIAEREAARRLERPRSAEPVTAEGSAVPALNSPRDSLISPRT